MRIRTAVDEMTADAEETTDSEVPEVVVKSKPATKKAVVPDVDNEILPDDITGSKKTDEERDAEQLSLF
jgi:hypothetical protein